MHQAHPTEDIYNGLHFLFYLFLETARIADFSWMKYGIEQILFLQNYGINLLNFLSYC